MRPLMAFAVLGVGLAARLAPAQVPQPQPLPPAVTTDTAVNTLTVQNQRRVPVSIYLEHGRFDRRLGIVGAQETRTLPLPAWAVDGRAAIQLVVHPAGEVADLASPVFALRPPARLGLVVPPWGELPPMPGDTMSAVIPPEALAEATLTVDNPRAHAVTVFAKQGRFDVRLGRVAPRSRATLRFPETVVLPTRSLRIFVHPDGGVDLESQLMTIRQGEHLALRVPK